MKPFLAVSAILLSIGGVSAQTSDMRELDRIIDRYHACFYASSQSQFVAKIDAEPNMVAERAFQACETEEQALFTFLTLRGTAPAVAQAIILKHRMALKHKITG